MWFSAFVHCKRLNGTLLKENISSSLPASWKVKTDLLWTGNLYQTTIDRSSNWAWLNGSLFKYWDQTHIIITDVGCGGCGFWENGTIFLTSNCSQKFSYFCGNDTIGKL